MTFSDLFKVTIIQRQITWKWHNIQLYLQWPTNRKSYMIYRTAPFSVTLNDPYPQFQCHAILWRWISHKLCDIQTGFQWNTNRDLHTPYSRVSFRMTSSVLEWLSEIFNDTTRRAVSLRQRASCLSLISWTISYQQICFNYAGNLYLIRNNIMIARLSHWYQRQAQLSLSENI